MRGEPGGPRGPTNREENRPKGWHCNWRAGEGAAPQLGTKPRDIQELIEGQYKSPVGVFGFNPFEGWSRDVSEDVAQEIRRRCDLQAQDVPSALQDFAERHEGTPPIGLIGLAKGQPRLSRPHALAPVFLERHWTTKCLPLHQLTRYLRSRAEVSACR
jgi:hypothetical protein